MPEKDIDSLLIYLQKAKQSILKVDQKKNHLDDDDNQHLQLPTLQKEIS